MNEFLWVLIVFFVLTYVYNKKQKFEQDELIEPYKKRCEDLEKQIEYYKDLCKWHVEEKEKLKKGTLRDE